MDTPYASRHLSIATSTQDEARVRYRGVPLLVTADRQTAGRGRSGNQWLQAPRAVFASVAFRPGWDQGSWPRLTLVAALAARAAAAEVAPAPLAIKWPNDLLDPAGGKVAGLIAETAEDRSGPLMVAGAGINLWWPDAPDGMAALFAEDPGPDLGPVLASAWAAGLLARVGRGADDWGRAEYSSACVTIGHDVAWDENGVEQPAATAVDIDVDGALVVAAAGVRRRLISGDVRRVRDGYAPAAGEG